MILKGNQRTGAADLATHLSNEYDNTRVEIVQLRGVVADDLHGALAEFTGIARATRCKQPLYSLAINPADGSLWEQEHGAREARRRHRHAARHQCTSVEEFAVHPSPLLRRRGEIAAT